MKIESPSISPFSQQVALVTGATSGLGRATALALAAAGARVVLSGRRVPEGEAVVAEIRRLGGEAQFFRADAVQEAEVAAIVAFTEKTYGRLTLAFNNAGVESFSPIADLSEADYRRTFDLNVWGVLAALKHELPALLRAGGGAVVNTSSVLGSVGMSGSAVYAATKHAVEGLTKAVALEYATQGVRVNAIAPAAIATEMLERLADTPEKQAYFANLHPVNRVGQPDDIARGVLYLLDPRNTFVTGTTLAVDGGFLAR